MKNEFRKTYEMLVKDVIGTIIVFVESQPERKLYVDDYRGSLIVNVIDDQASEVIQSIELEGDKPIARCGVYEEEWNQPLSEFSLEMLLNILDAVEEAYDATEEREAVRRENKKEENLEK